MKLHWKILIWLLGGVLLGGLFQMFLEARPTSGLRVADGPGGARVMAGLETGTLAEGDLITALIANRGSSRERRTPTPDAKSYRAAILQSRNGEVVWLRLSTGVPRPLTLKLAQDCPRALWIRPFSFLADLFLRLLKMLIVPIILTSIVTGVVGVGSGRNLRRLGGKTLLYYAATSLLAIVTGLLLVNVMRPGQGARLGLGVDERFSHVASTSLADVILRMVPENVFAAFSANINMLQVIFFALLFGSFILTAKERHKKVLKDFFEAAFEVMMKLASAVLALIPYGVFCLLVKVVGTTGFSVFKPLGLYMLTVVSALLIHSLVTLPLVLRLLARISPWRWAKAMGPALVTAFSTSSSSMTLPVSLDVVEKRGGISNRVVSFVQPLGATINMDGTALYECIGVIFLAQYYQGLAHFSLGWSEQVLVVFMALLASVGAAGIPSAGLIMMVTILGALNLPAEGAALLLAVDRPLDMLRTATNVWSDTCGAAVIARSEGEKPLSLAEPEEIGLAQPGAP